ncbi:NlpC/P60 family protein [Actinomyces sp.]|uniref:C40 family peptidase n=1 Tax=Actinomyces sp. TaxID=29317 RepID=UPI0026DC1A3D|nr:C40 family peptidase [Actinomyces sp.]MDO4900516.1 C40 family peptidase [Actinomyces sp.]
MTTTNRTRRTRAARRVGALAAALALAVTLAPAASSDEVTQDDIDQSKTAEQTTRTSIAGLEAELAQLTANTTAAELKAAIANEDYLTALGELDTATTEADKAQDAADAAAADTEKARADLGAVVVEAYQEGSSGSLDALAPYLSGKSLGDATDISVALERTGENTDAELQNVEALQAVADTMQSIADGKVDAKQTAADAAATAKADADAAATAAQTAQATAETKRANLIAKLAEQRNTTVELETAYQNQLEAERKAREEAAAKEAAEKAAAEQAAAEAAQAAQPQAPEESTGSPEPAESSESPVEPDEDSAQPAAPAPVQNEDSSQSYGGDSSGSPGVSQQTSSGSSGGAQAAISAAYSYIGVPYVWAGESYGGVDCSGLTMLAYRAAGVYLTHSSRAQYGEGTLIPLGSAQPGDLVFWSSNGTQSGIYHVAIYLGDGQMIEAPTFGYTVRVTAMRYSGTMPYAVRP